MRGLLFSIALLACDSEPIAPVDAGEDAGAGVSSRRVLFVVQNSFSMGAADPDLRRKSLVEEAFDAIEGDVRFAVIVYSDGWRESTFVADPKNDAQIAFLLRRLETTENLGVLDGALLRAREVLVEAQGAEPDPSIRWSVVIMTDGFPTPTCTAGNDINPVCEAPRDQWAMFGVNVDDPSVFYGFEGAGGAYNQRADAVARVTELMPLATTHAILLYSESIVGQPVEQSLGLNRVVCAAFVEQLAATGRGSVETRDGFAFDWNAFVGN